MYCIVSVCAAAFDPDLVQSGLDMAEIAPVFTDSTLTAGQPIIKVQVKIRKIQTHESFTM